MYAPRAVDKSDWLKTVAIIMVSFGHFGYFFIDDAGWWSVIGRAAAPAFFFFLGYGISRTVPFLWIWLGVILTLLDSWNNNWNWVAPNILLSFALIRYSRPYVQILLQRYDWIAFALLIFTLIALLPIADYLVDYGAEGWLWALFGLCQRMYVDGKSDMVTNGMVKKTATTGPKTVNMDLKRGLICTVATVVYVWQEQLEFAFSQTQLVVVILLVCAMSHCLYRFMRGPSSIQPPDPIATVLQFVGKRTLAIYAIPLAGFELVVQIFPDLAA